MLRLADLAIFNRNKCHTSSINSILRKRLCLVDNLVPFFTFLDCSLASLRLIKSWRQLAIHSVVKLLLSKLCCCIAVGSMIAEALAATVELVAMMRMLT
jgi:hypothetical protein